jgi:hypothetical protein
VCNKELRSQENRTEIPYSPNGCYKKNSRVQKLRCLSVNGQIAAAFEPNVYKFILFYEKRDVKKNRELNSIKMILWHIFKKIENEIP